MLTLKEQPLSLNLEPCAMATLLMTQCTASRRLLYNSGRWSHLPGLALIGPFVATSLLPFLLVDMWLVISLPYWCRGNRWRSEEGFPIFIGI